MRLKLFPDIRSVWITLFYLVLASLILPACASPDRTVENKVTAEVRELDRLVTRYYREGRLDDAILYAREIVKRVERAVGPDDIHLAQPLNNLAVLYEQAGRYDDAEALYRRVLTILATKLGPDHIRTTLNRAALGSFYVRRNKLAEARVYYEQSIKALEQRLGPDHPLLAEPLSGLAGVMLGLDQPQEAWTLLERARNILEKAGTKEQLRLAAVLQSESGIKMKLGDYDEAENLMRKALSIIDDTLGPEHAMASEVRSRLAHVLLYKHDYSGTADLLAQSLENVRHPTERATAMYTAENRSAFVKSIQDNLNLYLQLLLQNKTTTGNDAARAYTVWLQYKDLDLKIQPAWQAAFLAKGCADDVEPYQSYVRAALDLARTDMAAPGPKEISGYKKGRDNLIQQRNKQESDLMAVCPAFAAQIAEDTAGPTHVMAALEPDEVLVEYVRLESVIPNDKSDTQAILPERYAIFVILPDSIRLLDLGPAEPIDSGVWANEVTPNQPPLKDLLLNPLEPYLSGKTQILIAPQGALNMVPFESLVSKDIAVRVIPSGSVLVGKNTASPAVGQSMFFIDPDFDQSPETRAKILQKLNITKKVQPDGKRGQGMWGFQLAPSMSSAIGIIGNNGKGVSTAGVYSGEEALEDILRSQSNPPQTLMIKTLCLKVPTDAAGNPLRDIALAMAGANPTLANPDSSGSQGILTAEETILTNFTNTNVTLITDCFADRSGDTTRILRRSFFRAGARSVLFNPN